MTAQQNGTATTSASSLSQQERRLRDVVAPLLTRSRNAEDSGHSVTSQQTAAGERVRLQLDQPLLLIAGGGSGREIATCFKAALIESHGAMPVNARIVAFDSAADPITCVESRFGRVVELERGREFFHLERVPLAGIKRNLKAHSELYERLGSALLHISRASIQDGAAQERGQGLLSLMWSATAVDRILENALRQLAQRSASVEGRLTQQRGINVVVVGSTAGGQGSGSLIDLTYLARERLGSLGDLGESSRVIGMFVLPGALVGVQGPNLLPNTHAFFLELDALQQGAGFEARYPGGLHIQSMERPFDYVYVLDGIDEHGKAWPNQKEVCAMGARALSMLFGDSVGALEIFNAINEQGLLQRSSPNGRGAYLATAGQAVIRFPARQIVERCARRQAQEALGHLLTAPRAEEIADAAFGERLDAAAIDRLRNHSDGAPHQAQLYAPAGLQKAPAEEIPSQARTLVANYMQRRIFGECYTEMAKVAVAFQAETSQRLEEHLQRLLRSGRFLWARLWLQGIQAQFDRQINGLSAEYSNLSQAVERGQAALESAAAAMDQAAGSFIIWRQSHTRSALALYLDEAVSLAQLRIEQRVRQLALQAMREAQQWVAGQSSAVDAIILNLEQAQRELALEDELTRSLAAQREIVLADADLVEHLYRSYCAAAESDARSLLAASDDVVQWAYQAPAGLVEAACNISRRSFAAIQELTVEDILRLRWDDRSAQQWIERLRSLAAGGWNLDRSLLPGGGAQLAAFLTLGVPDSAASIFADSGVTLVSTQDRERIIALSTVYGASFDTLKPARAWQGAYKTNLSRTPLHVLPQFLRNNEDHAVHAFVLGVVFGVIYNQATWFYYRPADALAQPIRLGQGIDNVLCEFGVRSALHEEIMARVEQRIAVEGVARSLELLDAYVNAGPSGDETTQKLRRAARDYAEELRRSHRVAKSEG